MDGFDDLAPSKSGVGFLNLSARRQKKKIISVSACHLGPGLEFFHILNLTSDRFIMLFT